MDRERLGKRIVDLRKADGLSQLEFSERAGISERTLSDIETGKGNPGLEHIEDIERALKTPLITLADTLLRPPDKYLSQLINGPEGASHLTVASVLARLMNESPEVRAAVLVVLYGDQTIARLNASTGK